MWLGKQLLKVRASEINQLVEKYDLSGAEEALAKINLAILVTKGTDKVCTCYEKAAAVITEVGLTSHAALEVWFRHSCSGWGDDALRLLEEGLIVTVDSSRGLVFKVLQKVYKVKRDKVLVPQY